MWQISCIPTGIWKGCSLRNTSKYAKHFHLPVFFSGVANITFRGFKCLPLSGWLREAIITSPCYTLGRAWMPWMPGTQCGVRNRWHGCTAGCSVASATETSNGALFLKLWIYICLYLTLRSVIKKLLIPRTYRDSLLIYIYNIPGGWLVTGLLGPGGRSYWCVPSRFHWIPRMHLWCNPV